MLCKNGAIGFHGGRGPKPLHEFLAEQQEPFRLEDYLLEKGCSVRRLRSKLYGISGDDSTRERRESKSPGSHGGTYNPSTSKKRRRSCDGQTRTAALIFQDSEEYYSCMNEKRFKSTLLDRDSLNAGPQPDNPVLCSKSSKNLCPSFQSYVQGVPCSENDLRMKKAKKRVGKSKKLVLTEKKCSVLKLIFKKLAPRMGFRPDFDSDIDDFSLSFSMGKEANGEGVVQYTRNAKIKYRVNESAQFDFVKICTCNEHRCKETEYEGCKLLETSSLANVNVSKNEENSYVKKLDSISRKLKSVFVIKRKAQLNDNESNYGSTASSINCNDITVDACPEATRIRSVQVKELSARTNLQSTPEFGGQISKKIANYDDKDTPFPLSFSWDSHIPRERYYSFGQTGEARVNSTTVGGEDSDLKGFSHLPLQYSLDKVNGIERKKVPSNDKGKQCNMKHSGIEDRVKRNDTCCSNEKSILLSPESVLNISDEYEVMHQGNISMKNKTRGRKMLCCSDTTFPSVCNERDPIDWKVFRTKENNEVLGSARELIIGSPEIICASKIKRSCHSENKPHRVTKERTRQERNIIFDLVKEALESTGKGYFSNFQMKCRPKTLNPRLMTDVICHQMCKWMELDTNIAENLAKTAWRREDEEWTRFPAEKETLGIEIETTVVDFLIEELVVDLGCLRPSSRSYRIDFV